METFTLAAISLTIAISLVINKKRDALQLSFAALCMAIFFLKGGTFFHDLLKNSFWNNVADIGLVSIAPLAIRFTSILLNGQSFLTTRYAIPATIIAFLLAITTFTPFYRWPYTGTVLWAFSGLTLGLCYLSLIHYIRSKVVGVEKKRLIYLATASSITAALSLFDLFRYFGYDFPPLADILIAGLLYFIFMFITRHRLIEIQELMARTLFIAILTMFAAIAIYSVIGLFGMGAPLPFTPVLLASFVIVISIGPFREILEKLFSTIYPDSKDLFTSMFSFDEKIEREKSMMLEEMAPVLAHEIRNPLGSIKGAAQYLRSEANNEENQKLLDVIIEEVNRLNSVVSQFLDYAKPYTLTMKPMDINQIIEKAVSIIKANDISEKITIEKELRPHLPPIKADQEQLIQVILNIAFNGIEAMPEGGKLIFRTTKIESDMGEAIGVSIRDTGTGIKKEELINIFKPFFTTKERGVGLGLAICRKIIKTHGGNIRVKSILGQGSIFYIRLGTAY
jgi:two-component system, NtrC family, sensor histidine kinase HydH